MKVLEWVPSLPKGESEVLAVACDSIEEYPKGAAVKEEKSLIQLWCTGNLRNSM